MDRAGWDARCPTTELVWKADPEQFLVAEVGELTPVAASDLGAEEGRSAVCLARRGRQATAVGFSAVGVAKAALLADAAGVTLTTVCVEAGDLVPPPGGFDLVALNVNLPAAVRTALHRRAGDAVAAGGTPLVVGHEATSQLAIDRADRGHRTTEIAEAEGTAIDALVRAHRSGRR